MSRQNSILIFMSTVLIVFILLAQQANLSERVTTTPEVLLRHESPSLSMHPQPEKDLSCDVTNATLWEEWSDCINTLYADREMSFQEYLKAENKKASWPWGPRSPYSVVLLEFRCGNEEYQRALEETIKNVMKNLPVMWTIQVQGSRAVVDHVERSYPTEVGVGKIIATDLGIDNMEQKRVSLMYTNRTFYEGLLGDTWLFVQTDSRICSKQRNLLQEFLAKDYAYWGAPWKKESTWPHQPWFCGNGGFSMRTRYMTMAILERFQIDPEHPINEDNWYCTHALELTQNATLATALRRPPAPAYEEMRFAVESVMHQAPFAVHKPFFLPANYEFRKLVENCNEILELVAPNWILYNDWGSLLCALDKKLTEKKFNLEHCKERDPEYVARMGLYPD